MSIAKAERLLDLVIALLNAPYFRTAAWIRSRVAGYDAAASDDAFARMFERDKSELRDLGIPIETNADGDAYRIRPGEFALPPMSFTPAESAALAVAARLWETTVLAEAGSAAMRKLRDAADDEDDGAAPPDPNVARGVLARLRTPEPAFAEILVAIRAGRAIRFDYRAAGRTHDETRTVEPWGLVNYRGAWYVVGRDTDRDGRRTFRLSRIAGRVTAFGPSGIVTVPDDVVLRDEVVASADRDQGGRALVRVRVGAAAGIRRDARVLSAAPDADGFEELAVPIGRPDDLARRLASHGPDVVVVEPPELRSAVLSLLRGAGRAAGVVGGAS